MKKTLIIVGVVISILIMFACLFLVTKNKAIDLEEQVQSATASVEVQEKRRIDLIKNIVDCVKDYAKYENRTLKEVTDMRVSANDESIKEAKLNIQAVAEKYPDLKASENYKQLMSELSITENMIAQHRENYNMQVRNYNKYIRKFPANLILNSMGYEKIESKYTEYKAKEDASQNLFD
ncbi:TPA: LemA family protein [Clostridioides difficile]|nr:LemA family protein [Clostridioides difficile]MCA0614461.1 LemA family protein [Clostridioides difficile]MCI4288416.1 LemA family protein [Clostridioides difficile]MCP3252854.1 LemA family protein [Clostridioides difficile]VHX25459.1 lemA like protein [Clostridioides difficile]HBE9819927.1 LemA family protein [Clostridioides difficile]